MIMANDQMVAQMSKKGGFIAALDQSGGSSPGALRLYGIPDTAYEGEAEMFRLIHQMRARIMTAPAFTGDKVIGTILFEGTMDGEVRGKPTAAYLWEERQVVPFIKVDRGLEPEKDGVQLMRPMPRLDQKPGQEGRRGDPVRRVEKADRRAAGRPAGHVQADPARRRRPLHAAGQSSAGRPGRRPLRRLYSRRRLPAARRQSRHDRELLARACPGPSRLDERRRIRGGSCPIDRRDPPRLHRQGLTNANLRAHAVDAAIILAQLQRASFLIAGCRLSYERHCGRKRKRSTC